MNTEDLVNKFYDSKGAMLYLIQLNLMLLPKPDFMIL